MKKFIYGISAAVICTLLSVQLAHSINTNNLDDFLLSNVEALSQSETHDRQSECYNNGGNWNMASVCVDSGFYNTTCTVEGELSLFGFTIKGKFTVGNSYDVAWARYSCQASEGNCCTKQGLFSGENQLA